MTPLLISIATLQGERSSWKSHRVQRCESGLDADGSRISVIAMTRVTGLLHDGLLVLTSCVLELPAVVLVIEGGQSWRGLTFCQGIGQRAHPLYQPMNLDVRCSHSLLPAALPLNTLLLVDAPKPRYKNLKDDTRSSGILCLVMRLQLYVRPSVQPNPTQTCRSSAF